jgi:hypothetical protein
MKREAFTCFDIFSGHSDFSAQPPLLKRRRPASITTPGSQTNATWVTQLPLGVIDRFLVMELNHAEAARSI